MNNTNDTDAVQTLYYALLDAWNRRSAADFAALFTDDGSIVGFDGSMSNSRAEIEAHLSPIFADHPTGKYIGIVREVRFLNPEAALVRTVAGIIPAGQGDINPAQNSVQSLVAVKQNGQWRIAMYQNTPARFDGRPEAAQQLTGELRGIIRQGT
jgi:uncharacterized protein (TIGR02246 family)